ncbi:MAG TPA: (Fe-S)-binding protein [Tepidisphaeraceae bacterium]|nr:(Fe-S)-binding protein [Tepidisphaeraceae bacterium]
MRTVALFITCLADQFYPRVGVAVTKVLEKLDCRVEFPKDQTCCGQPFFNNGFEKEARRLAQRMEDIFAGYEYVVTPSGSCCAMLRQHHGGAMGKKTYEFSEFLSGILGFEFSSVQLPRPQSLVYHYTCHLRNLGIGDRSGQTLGRIGNIKLLPLDRADQCCGFGGTFAVQYPAISGAIAEDKARCIAASGAPTLICDDAGCAMNISGMCHRKNIPIRVMHTAELLAEAMGLDTSRW